MEDKDFNLNEYIRVYFKKLEQENNQKTDTKK